MDEGSAGDCLGSGWSGIGPRVGVDAVAVERLKRQAEDQSFLERLFTAKELAYCQAKSRPAEHLAARFAAKEAVFKALGTGWSEGVSWKDVEVVNRPSGEPQLLLHGRAAQLARELRCSRFAVSLSHTKELAIALVILC
jgi:holo-[acyl-carrier protein] synthase